MRAVNTNGHYRSFTGPFLGNGYMGLQLPPYTVLSLFYEGALAGEHVDALNSYVDLCAYIHENIKTAQINQTTQPRRKHHRISISLPFRVIARESDSHVNRFRA